MKDEELKKASLNTLTKGNKPTKSSSTALKANWESSSSSSGRCFSSFFNEF